MSLLSADDITQAEHYTKPTEVKRWLILMLYVSVYLPGDRRRSPITVLELSGPASPLVLVYWVLLALDGATDLLSQI